MATEIVASGAPSSVQAVCSDRRPSLPSALPESIGWRIPRRGKTKADWAALWRSAQKRVRLASVEPDSKKGGPKAALSQNPAEQNQFAFSVGGLSIAALSLVAGAAAGVVVVAAAEALMPCSRSSAIFRALSSLASGGT